MSTFTNNIRPFVEAELAQAKRASQQGDAATEFTHLENAHVLGQESTFWHVKTHVLMLAWAWRQRRGKEMAGQLFRIAGAALATPIGKVPTGNTGGANVSPFKEMPIPPEQADIIAQAKTS